MVYLMRRMLQFSIRPTRAAVLGVAVAASIGLAVHDAGAVRVPNLQKVSVKLVGDCSDGTMDEADGDESCILSVVVSPKTPVRTFTVQEAAPGAKKWSTATKVKATSGKVDFEVPDLEDDSYRDGTFAYRVSAPKIGKEKAYTSPTIKITFTPAEVGDDIGDDLAGDEVSAAPTKTTAPKSTSGTTATTPTTVAHSTGGGSTTQTTVAATTTTIAAGTNGGTPTNTTAPNNEDPNWWGGLAPTMDNLGAYCDSGDPTMYVGSTICSSTGIGGRKSVSQFKSLISTISNNAPQYKRNGFCTQAMFKFGYNLATQASKCAEVDAGR